MCALGIYLLIITNYNYRGIVSMPISYSFPRDIKARIIEDLED
jgi:hypothetical protein